MGTEFLDWLVADFYVFGLRIQYWMPLFVVVFAITFWLSVCPVSC
jgi:hypothetical protein